MCEQPENKQTNKHKNSVTHWRNENYGACMLFPILFTNLLISPNDFLFSVAIIVLVLD